jgi:hypothetical protein
MLTFTQQSVEISRGVRQTCPLSPTPFNMYINEIFSEWSTGNIQGMQLTRNKEIKTLLFYRLSGNNGRI